MDDQAWLDCSYPRNKGPIMEWLIAFMTLSLGAIGVVIYVVLWILGSVLDKSEYTYDLSNDDLL